MTSIISKRHSFYFPLKGEDLEFLKVAQPNGGPKGGRPMRATSGPKGGRKKKRTHHVASVQPFGGLE